MDGSDHHTPEAPKSLDLDKRDGLYMYLLYELTD
jgi:hypothetical protein